MPFSYPRDMPTVGVARQYFEVDRLDYLSQSVDGRVGAITAGAPLWRARWASPNSAVAGLEWRAFIESLQGAQRLFLGRDLTRPYPLAYLTANGGVAWPGAFGGDATGWTTNTNRDLVEVEVPTGFKLSTSDMLGFGWTTAGEKRRHVSRALETGVAAGGKLQLAVNPPVPLVVPDWAEITFDRPECLMRQVTDQTELGELDRRLKWSGQLSAIQVLLP